MMDDVYADPRVLEGQVRIFASGLSEYVNQGQALSDCIDSFGHLLQRTRNSYNDAVRERNFLYEQLRMKLEKLSKCKTTLQRYECANDPVVGSDGYTYERGELEGYFSECKSTNSKAYSHQTEEEITDRIVSNLTLVALSKELVRVIEPHSDELPAFPQRSLIDGGGKPVLSNSGMKQIPNSVPLFDPFKFAHPSAGRQRSRGGEMGDKNRWQNNRAKPYATAPFDTNAGGDMGDGLGAEKPKPEFHPCLRIYHLCNFNSDCTFANYPYEACLNHIKGKCRFGSHCKELHVDRDDPRYVKVRSGSGAPRISENPDNAEAQSGNNDPYFSNN